MTYFLLPFDVCFSVLVLICLVLICLVMIKYLSHTNPTYTYAQNIKTQNLLRPYIKYTNIRTNIHICRAMSIYGATHTQAPNFAYALVVRKFKEAIASGRKDCQKLDLGSLQHMINAAGKLEVEGLKG